ncbi:unnamed protein product [Adineta steineri]|uniref:Uncharacterized protein n=1 Tax=Adineta steineri TaxID=433720 RepID=A0A819NYI8_9BILA|nr:unnamed protein product [Adineta steineri]CAF4004203.1 unnamed protein product [Adineta steineri]
MLCQQEFMLLFLTFILILPLYAERKSSFRNTFSCFKCTHHDKPQEIKEAACMKKFDSSKYTHEECQSENGPGKCLKSYEKTEARTKKQIEEDERSVTIRKCVSQGELDFLKNVRNIDTSDGCHTMRSTKTKHKTARTHGESTNHRPMHDMILARRRGQKKVFLTNSQKSVFELHGEDENQKPPPYTYYTTIRYDSNNVPSEKNTPRKPVKQQPSPQPSIRHQEPSQLNHKPTPVPQPGPVAKRTPVPQPVPVAKPTPVPQSVPVAKPTPAAKPIPIAQQTTPVPYKTVEIAPKQVVNKNPPTQPAVPVTKQRVEVVSQSVQRQTVNAKVAEIKQERRPVKFTDSNQPQVEQNHAEPQNLTHVPVNNSTRKGAVETLVNSVVIQPNGNKTKQQK